MLYYVDLQTSVEMVLTLLLFSVAAPVFLIPFTYCILFGFNFGANNILFARIMLCAGLIFGFIGMSAGFMTGFSRQPAVAALVPAILTFIGVAAAFIFGRGNSRASIVGFAVFVFSINTLFGSLLGAHSRHNDDVMLASEDTQMDQADQEARMRRYRIGLHLPVDPPKASPAGTAP